LQASNIEIGLENLVLVYSIFGWVVNAQYEERLLLVEGAFYQIEKITVGRFEVVCRHAGSIALRKERLLSPLLDLALLDVCPAPLHDKVFKERVAP
jgi:hypothetical protein